VTRTYNMARRSESASRTNERIADCTEELLSSLPIGEVTLQAIATGSGVSVQTVLRHMGSRDGCLAAVRERVSARIQDQLADPADEDVESAITNLCAHYEAEGRLVLNLLRQEDTGDELAKEAVATGRTFHRTWVERCFQPMLADPTQAAIDALVVATDIYVWKVLRLDLHRSAAATQAVMSQLVHAQLESK